MWNAMYMCLEAIMWLIFPPVPLVFCNTQEDVQPYYEAYAHLAKSLKNDEEFQVRLNTLLEH